MNEPREVNIWGIHSEDDALFLQQGIIGIGWNQVGDFRSIASSRDAFKEKIDATYPGSKKGYIALVAGMLYRFLHEMKIGDYVIFPSKADRMVNIGKITGEYDYQPGNSLYDNIRKVEWLKHLPRRVFSQGALYEIGSAMTLFSVKNYADEFMAKLEKKTAKEWMEDEEDHSVAATADDIMENTCDYIQKELSRLFKGYDLENLVSDLLNAMGYRTTVSPHGGDSGIDIIAYKDELPPRIAVQVKSQDSDIKETTIQSLKGAMMPGDYGLFVTLSGYTKNAQKFLDANPIIRGINGAELANLILKYYESLSEKYQQMIPLKKVYIPVTKAMKESL